MATKEQIQAAKRGLNEYATSVPESRIAAAVDSVIAASDAKYLPGLVAALKRCAEYADRAEAICAKEGYFSGDSLSLTEIQEACPTLGVMRQCREALANLPEEYRK